MFVTDFGLAFLSAVKHFGLASASHLVTLWRKLGHTLAQAESHFGANFEIVVFLEHVCKVRASQAESHFVANFEIVVFLEQVCKVRASWLRTAKLPAALFVLSLQSCSFQCGPA